jgi:hypothetical protein
MHARPFAGGFPPALLCAAGILALTSCTATEGPNAGSGTSPDPNEALDRIASLPYTDFVGVVEQDIGKSGLVAHLPGEAQEGLNLHVVRPEPRALLMAMDGRIVHSWSSEEGQPDSGESGILAFLGGWHHAELTPEGLLLAIVENGAVLALDPGSKPLWSARLPAHHDLAVEESGDILVLAAARSDQKGRGGPFPVLDEEIVRLSPSGQIRGRFSLLEILREDPRTTFLIKEALTRIAGQLHPDQLERTFQGMRRGKSGPALDRINERIDLYHRVLAGEAVGSEALRLGMLRNTPGDLLHANSLEILREAPGGLWEAGDLLVSIRNLDLIAVVDPRRGRIRWSWGPGHLERQHQPSLTEEGGILVFDNGPRSRRSRLVEVDPRTSAITWEWIANPPGAFYSPVRGGVERLANGNLLVTSSERGRAFEMNREGRVVWDYYTPVRERTGGRRSAIYRMTRLPSSILKSLAGGMEESGPAD